MKKINLFNLIKKAILLGSIFPLWGMANEPIANQMLFPEDYKVYYSPGIGVINYPVNGTIEKILPTKNIFSKTPGCYIACYSHQEKNSVYPVAKDIFVMGQIRVEGRYEGRICKPKGYENKDISAEAAFKKMCEYAFTEACPNLGCWAGGDTGGWFGVQ